MVEETPWQQALRYENRPNPYPFYEELRKTPVARQPDGSYVVSTYRELVQLLHDPRVSSDQRKLPVPVENPFVGTIITTDPPEHDVDRRRMMRHFGPPECPHMIAGFEPQIRRIFTGLFDGMQGKTRIDLVDEFAFPGPVTVICEVLGVPLEDIPSFHAWIETALDGLDLGPEATTEEQQRRAAAVPAAVTQLRQHLGDLLDQYRERPGPGVLSGMANDDGPEGPLSQEAAIGNAMLMLFAGHETTVNLIAHSVLSLLRHPDQLETLRRRPGLIVPGIEELLRFESSVQFWPTRSALEDIEIAGTTIPAGAPIFVAYGAANRDPKRFENPDKLDLERPNNEHVGYSQGIHYCFGAPLARLEVQIGVSEFIRRAENPRLVEDPPPYRRNQIFRGPKHLWLDIDGVRD
ncbi:cytochrome P450 [Solirubrobacter ginsenosidimutans]|uniref:Cytochrome P450 n=1 Tax=Solirubrobacter ginsenosidimutans TaxID=490573 RepID=A0A9X3MWH4_9ACTN|nr:cytochrome P450 [Solirubrobacter ginsenosidimutans]MDA0162633.1 cytochrome P450 [Solirubrobacter ginsenosidimutans]